MSCWRGSISHHDGVYIRRLLPCSGFYIFSLPKHIVRSGSEDLMAAKTRSVSTNGAVIPHCASRVADPCPSNVRVGPNASQA